MGFGITKDRVSNIGQPTVAAAEGLIARSERGLLERLAARAAVGRIGPAGMRQLGSALAAVKELKACGLAAAHAAHPVATWLKDVADFEGLATGILAALVEERFPSIETAAHREIAERSPMQISDRPAASAVAARITGPACRAWAISTGTRPFSMSPASVTNAAFLPPMRSTLVAPGLLEPWVRGSGSPMARHTRMALEMEPSR